MMRRNPQHRGTLLAALAVLASLGFALWSLQQALELDPLPLPDSTGVSVSAPRAPERTSIPLRSVLAAAEKDPFRPERNRSATRFLLPEERLAAAAQPVEAVAAAPQPVHLLGTMVLPEGRSVALCQIGGESPRLVRVGQSIGELTLQRVEQGKAVFTSSRGGRVEVFVPKQGT